MNLTEHGFGTGWPDEFVNKSPEIRPNPFLVKINTILVQWKKGALEFALLLQFSTKWPKKTISQYVSEKSPNLVALIVQFPEARCQGDQIG
jgi:hypothetical protein